MQPTPAAHEKKNNIWVWTLSLLLWSRQPPTASASNLKEQLGERGQPVGHVGLHNIKSAHTWMLRQIKAYGAVAELGRVHTFRPLAQWMRKKPSCQYNSARYGKAERSSRRDESPIWAERLQTFTLMWGCNMEVKKKKKLQSVCSSTSGCSRCPTQPPVILLFFSLSLSSHLTFFASECFDLFWSSRCSNRLHVTLVSEDQRRFSWDSSVFLGMSVRNGSA